MKILEFYPSDEQIARAKEMAEKFPLNRQSILNGTRNLYAFLGEVVAGDYLQKSGWVLHPTGSAPYDFDLLDRKGLKWEVKTKMTTVKPKGHFNCTIYTYRDQKCDGYIFTRCQKDLSRVWLLGWISKRDLLKYGTKYKEGDVDGNLVMTQEGVGITINKLNPFTI